MTVGAVVRQPGHSYGRMTCWRHLKTVLFARSYSSSFACARQPYFAMTRFFFVFLCDVLAVFLTLRHHNQFVYDDGDTL